MSMTNECLDRDVLKRTCGLAQLAGKRTRVGLDLGRDVVAVVVAAERLVAPQVLLVSRRLAGELLDLLDHARDHDYTDDDHPGGECCVEAQDDRRPWHTDTRVDRVDKRQQR
jgi:hypothetical protein